MSTKTSLEKKVNDKLPRLTLIQVFLTTQLAVETKRKLQKSATKKYKIKLGVEVDKGR